MQLARIGVALRVRGIRICGGTAAGNAKCRERAKRGISARFCQERVKMEEDSSRNGSGSSLDAVESA